MSATLSPSVGAVHKSVRIPVGEAFLPGDLQLPEGGLGLVLFAHGSGSSRNSPRNQFVAQIIRDAGVGTLLFDLLTSEEEKIDDADLSLRFNIPFLADRLLAATRWVTSQPEIAGLPLGFFGASTGGGAALVAAANSDVRIDAVVSRGGRPDLAGDALPQVRCPTMLIVGGMDDVVVGLNEGAFAKLRCEKSLKIVPGATHLFAEPGTLKRAAQFAAVWFRRHFTGTGTHR